MNICELSSKYDVRKLTENDVEMIYRLSLGNPLYFRHCPPPVTRDSVREDMKALPPNVKIESKYYIGFFAQERLIAVMDLLLGYPETGTAWIGLFMMEKREQGRGAGSQIISECAVFLRNQGCRRIGLAYAKGNPQSERFWLKNGFCHTGTEKDQGEYIAVPMERIL